MKNYHWEKAWENIYFVWMSLVAIGLSVLSKEKLFYVLIVFIILCAINGGYHLYKATR